MIILLRKQDRLETSLMNRSLLYLLDNISSLSKISLTIKGAKTEKSFESPKRVAISPQFFQSASCQRCAACCKRGISLVFTDTDVQVMSDVVCGKYALALPYNLEDIRKLLLGLQRFELKIWLRVCKSSGVEVISKIKPVWIYPMPAKKVCDFLQKKDGQWICSVHAVKPTNCLLPHIWVGFSRKDLATRLSKRPFGSRWISDCESQFGKFSLGELETWDLFVLQRMLRNAQDLGIDTYLPEIIGWLKNWLKVYKVPGFGIGVPKGPVWILDEKAKEIKTDDRKFF